MDSEEWRPVAGYPGYEVSLYATLPGGTLDQVLRLMLERKASQLVVRF